MTKGTILTITGSDATGESGIQADIRTISALGCVALSAITSVTMQNTIGIQEFYDIPAPVVGGQIEAIVNDVQPQAVKIGLVRRSETLDVIVRALRSYRPDFVIYDPLLFSSRGDRLMGDDMLRHIQTQLLPLCTAIVVNRHDARQILGDDIRPNVFFIDDATCHGLANGFSSSLAAYLCKGLSLDDAVDHAHIFSRHQCASVTTLQGRGSQLYNDFIRLVQQHFALNSDVAFYADQLNVGSAYLGQVCRRIAGRNPKAIIDEYILNDAQRMLTTSEVSIQEIAARLGFSSQAHLSRFFKKLTGLSPSAYREERHSQEEGRHNQEEDQYSQESKDNNREH